MGLEELSFHAVSIARSMPLRDLTSCFPNAQLRLTRAVLAVQYEGRGSMFCFDFGAIVFINIDLEEQQRTLERIDATLSDAVDRPTFDEELKVRIDPGLKQDSLIAFDHVVVPELSVQVAEVIARLLAQSAAVERYEIELDNMIAVLETQNQVMTATGRLGASRTQIMKLIAKSIETKNRIIGKLSLLDKPELAWESEQIDHLHDRLRAMLELGDRFQTVEYKLRAVQETVTLVLGLMQNRRFVVLEATIVLLIAVEIVLALFRIT